MGRGRQGPRQKLKDLRATIENLLQNDPITHGADFVEWEHLAEAEADHPMDLPAEVAVDLTAKVNRIILQTIGHTVEFVIVSQVPRRRTPSLTTAFDETTERTSDLRWDQVKVCRMARFASRLCRLD